MVFFIRNFKRAAFFAFRADLDAKWASFFAIELANPCLTFTQYAAKVQRQVIYTAARKLAKVNALSALILLDGNALAAKVLVTVNAQKATTARAAALDPSNAETSTALALDVTADSKLSVDLIANKVCIFSSNSKRRQWMQSEQQRRKQQMQTTPPKRLQLRLSTDLMIKLDVMPIHHRLLPTRPRKL
jgi:hypothetical protein